MRNVNIKPKTMWISLTDICNNKCLWCYEKGNQSKIHGFIEREVVNKILNTMTKVGIKKCILIGGEPTLHPYLYEIIDDITQYDIPISLVSNGRQFSDIKNINKLKKAKINSLVLSIHGWSDETYTTFTRAKNGFSDLKKSINQLKEENINFGINIVLSKYTLNEINHIINFILWIKLRRVSFNIASPIVSRHGINADFVAEMKEYSSHIMDIYYKCKAHGINARFLLTVPHCIFSNEQLAQLSKTRSIVSGCQLLHEFK